MAFNYSGAGIGAACRVLRRHQLEGGRWDNGRFYYNRTVNNLGAVQIADPYNAAVLNATTVNRVSFNGGAGGIATTPTADERVAAAEERVPPTPVQKETRPSRQHQ